MVIAAKPDGPFVVLAHLRRGSPVVSVRQRVTAGEPIGECGNSGNSTEPHLHVQVTDSTDWRTASGVPLAFWRSGKSYLPAENEIVDV